MDEATRNKACTRCLVTKPEDQFNRSRKTADGRTYYCKACAVAQARECAERRKLAGPSRQTAAKSCTVCHVEKAPTEFYPRPTSSDGLTSDCKECVRERRRRSAAANRDRETEFTRRWREKNRDQYDAYMQRWRDENADAIRAYRVNYRDPDPEATAARKREWYRVNREAILARIQTDEAVRAARAEANRKSRERNRDRHAERERQRRAAKLGCTVDEVDLEALWTGTCGLCLQPIDRALRWPDPMSKSLDHVIPLSRGGSHDSSNLQWTHLFCNVSKGARVPE